MLSVGPSSERNVERGPLSERNVERGPFVGETLSVGPSSERNVVRRPFVREKCCALALRQRETLCVGPS